MLHIVHFHVGLSFHLAPLNWFSLVSTNLQPLPHKFQEVFKAQQKCSAVTFGEFRRFGLYPVNSWVWNGAVRMFIPAKPTVLTSKRGSEQTWEVTRNPELKPFYAPTPCRDQSTTAQQRDRDRTPYSPLLNTRPSSKPNGTQMGELRAPKRRRRSMRARQRRVGCPSPRGSHLDARLER